MIPDGYKKKFNEKKANGLCKKHNWFSSHQFTLKWTLTKRKSEAYKWLCIPRKKKP
jgi:hypothetical protein